MAFLIVTKPYNSLFSPSYGYRSGHFFRIVFRCHSAIESRHHVLT